MPTSSSITTTSIRPTSVLVVEDNPNMLLLVEKVLSRRGYRTLTASNGQDALDVYQRYKEEIDVVLLDMGLPKISGREVLLKITSENPEVKVIVTSGYIEPDLNLEIGHDQIKFLCKPYTPDDVCNALKTLIEGAS